MEGRVVLINDHAFPRVPGQFKDARAAAIGALRGFLRNLVFYKDAGPGRKPDPFKLAEVYASWSQPGQQLAYPSAAVTEETFIDLGEHDLVPTMLEETYECFGADTVLWKTDELDGEFQVDFFANDLPTQEALMATLPGAFNPGETRSGVIVESEGYFDRPVRLTLVSHRRVTAPDAVFDRERRLVCRVSVQVDEVHLRQAKRLVPKIQVQTGP